MILPSEFKLGSEVFHLGSRYEVPCRLRYRIDDKKLSLRYDIINPQLLINDAFNVVLTQVEELTEITAHHGSFSGR